ncbi:MAG: hypothetical protein LBD76_05670 [Prevotellaceae bacterium]|jgi:hypothetical protein|nr:hypothetical protein [Prevotellaceae bacterium]
MNEGTLNTTIVNAFNNEFERRCISLLTNAYASVQTARCVDIACTEEYISAVLFDYISKFANIVEWRIDVAPEYRKYKDEILRKKKTKKSAPQISLKYSNWMNNTNLTYLVEAQNVIEIILPEKKKGKSRNPTIISDFHLRYIAKLDTCFSNKYPPRGCMVGYILQGETKYTVNCINHYLCNCNRHLEMLHKRPSKLKGFDACYISVHNNHLVQHLMFDFSNNKSQEEQMEDTTKK